jgi:dCTP deaminase
MILNDYAITKRAQYGMIAPFEPRLVREEDGVPVVSHGLGSYAYDMRLGYDFRWPTSGRLDPKHPAAATWQDYRTEVDPFDIPPHGFVLAQSAETWAIPADVYVLVVGKSTYARLGLIVNCTPMEPGWRGVLTLELSNTTDLPITVYPGEGIAAAIFFKGERPIVSYADRAGKYQDQRGIEQARV